MPDPILPPRPRPTHRGYVACESCGDRAQVVCAGVDDAALDFCAPCYIEHVELAHRGIPLPGGVTIEEARRLISGEET